MIIKKSKRKNKKYVVRDDKRTVHFGDNRYKDFLLMNDKTSKFYEPDPAEREKIKSLYRIRHKNDNLTNPFSAGALSYYLLWNKKTLKASIKDYEERFNIKIKT